MLRIIQQTTDNSAIIFKLEGKLLAPWIDETTRLVDSSLNANKSVALDLSKLSFTDHAGAIILADFIHRGATLTSCSAYVAALLHRENP
jgi:ABC-type transporter Mla MlaB component